VLLGEKLPMFWGDLFIAVEVEGTMILQSSFSGLEVACWPLVPKFAG